VAKAELGTKRICPNCGTKYYDLHRDPIICPHCGTRFDGLASKARPQTAVVDDEEEEIEAEVPAEAELVPLEEADAEVADTGAVVVEGEDDEVIEGEEEADDTFLEEEEEEGDEDVSTIIGDVDDEER
jgi:uncharacterized protein (TIGR02300 family)